MHLALLSGGASAEETKTVPGTANIFGAGHSAPPVAGYGGSGELPPGVEFSAGAGQTLSIVSATGGVTLDSVTNNAGLGPSGPDGGPFYSPTDVTSTGGISGIKATVTGFLAGVFLDAAEPSGGGPAVLDFTAAGNGTNFTTLAPVIGQVFFIGDGRTGTGGVQQFTVPDTATRLFLGIVDAADGDNAAGPPQAYADNGGSFSATVRIDTKVTKIVYNRLGDLEIMNADGSGKTNLTSGSHSVEIPALSADGKYVAFRGTQAVPAPGGGFLMGVWVMKAEPVGPTNQPVLVSANLNYAYNFSWHPDGQYLAMGEFVVSRPLTSVLRVRNALGEITPESAENPAVRMALGIAGIYSSGANFSPDGQYLAMSNQGRQIALLRAFDSEGGLTPESAGNPVVMVGTLDARLSCRTPEWSPDAMRVVFPQIQLDANLENPSSMLAVLAVRDAAGAITPESAANPRVVYTTPVQGSSSTESPSWSADGATIAFAGSPDANPGQNVFTILAGTPEDNVTNPRVMLTTTVGAATPRFAQSRKSPDASSPGFTLALSGLKNGQLLPPKTTVELRANLTPSKIPGLKINKVQFYLNGKKTGSPDTDAPYNYSSEVEAPGERVVTAVATDSQGRTVTSPPLSFTVTPAGAGQIALQTEVTPAGKAFAPGTRVTYRFLATNTSKSASAKGVTIVAPVPDDTKYYRAAAYDEKGNKLSPKPKVSASKNEVSFNLGDIPVGKTRRAELTVRVPYDALAGGDPIRSRDIHITGIGFGDQPFSGNFAEESRNIKGASPQNSPRLNLIKTIVDLADDENDGLVMIDDPELGLIPAAGPGDVLTLLLVAANYGGLPAERISIKDRLPEGCSLLPDSVRVNDVSAGAKVDGRTLNFQLGDLKAGELVVVSYQFSVLSKPAAGAPTPDTIIESVGAEVASMSLRASPGSSPERIPIKIARPVELQVVEHNAMPGDSGVNQPTTYTLKYSNVGNRIARDVMITDPIPQGTSYRAGSAFIHNAQAGQSVTQPDPQTLVFNLGDVAAKSSGLIEFTVDVNETVRDLKEVRVFNRPYFGSIAPGSAPGGAKGPNFAPDDGAANPIREECNPVSDANVPRMFLARIAPQSVKMGDPFTYTIVVGNMSDLSVSGGGGTKIRRVLFEIPQGAEFHSASVEGYQEWDTGKKYFIAALANIAATPDGRFPPHSAAAFTVTLRATGDVNHVISESSCHLATGFDYIFVPAAVTLIIEGDASSPTNQVGIAGAQLGAFGLDAAMAMLDDRVAKAVGRIHDRSSNIRIGGASYVQMTNGTTLIPLLGADQMVAIGSAALIGNDGATLIGNDGATLVAAGAGNLITFSGLIGNDGATLVGQDGGTIMSKIRLNETGNLVAAGAGNLVAAGGGNLIGLDGSTLVGNDGGSLATIASYLGAGGASLVAAGGGNLAGRFGQGIVVPGDASVTMNDPESLVAAAGKYLVAAGGGNLIGLDGATFGSSDASVALSFGANGTFTAGGGGARLVAAGAGN